METTSKRIENIKAFRSRVETDTKNAEIAKNIKLNNAFKSVKALAPRIKELIKVKNSLKENGIPYGCVFYGDFACNPNGCFTKYFMTHRSFITEGVRHDFGFYDCEKFPNVIGKCGGGFCGSNFLINEEGDIVSGLDKTDEEIIKLCEDFVNELGNFENDFYGFVDKIEEIYSQK